MTSVPANVKSPKPPIKPKPKEDRPAPAASAPRSEPGVPAVLSQTSRMHKVVTAMNGDDEFSVFSTSPVSRQKDPVDVNPDRKPRQKADGGGKLLRFFRGLIEG